ncbi:ATP-dependent DNA helicase RecG [Niabella soli]|uniref:ATP-dependent DNA helicase RecG n=1 Tax=Niabella soli DSM 19437 TaxID=929713 RepID=W0F2Y0_9BACT|nr:ATP-dependent DNA helicase RecG [Niabella soli]AHF15656.1 ATP-dependent DNA helicase RecG [Niabella soli DSM 19437]
MGPQRAELLQKELNIFTFNDLLHYFPFRHVDKTKLTPIGEINLNDEYVQVAGILAPLEQMGEKRGRRLTSYLQDKTGSLDLVWFQSINLIKKIVHPGQPYLVYGKVSFFMGKPQMVHPEMEPWDPEKLKGKDFLEPVYPSTEKLKTKNLGGRQVGKLTATLLQHLSERDIPENLPQPLREELKLIPRFPAYQQIHFPKNKEAYEAAVRRLKFEEIFFAQLRMNLLRSERHRFSKGVVFEKVGDLFNRFYSECLPFELTNAQKRVLKEIRIDTGRGKQMNRLLQGDVGSGKTVVALLCMLLAADNGYQSVLMAPTEILARQHFQGIKELLEPLPVTVAILTGTTKGKERRLLLEQLANGEINILIGTHAVIEDPVVFQNLGLVIIDEQHRFGVAQRARLWEKAIIPPHVLVMTATPIPRTLAMTAYGDLDYSVIDELPPGRKPIQTVHRLENDRSLVMDFLKAEIALGRQIYIIFPLIEESEKLDYENLMQGYDVVKTYFPEPQYWISMVHGKMPAHQKEENMRRFVVHDTQIMVSTTVIEVGVNVPNASVMLIESAEKFGLSQLHQLRGRVGRGAEKSYCILLSGKKLGNEARERMKIMTSTNNGFVIAEKDLELRGPGDIEGTRQSGVLSFKLADIVNDRAMVTAAKERCEQILKDDPDLSKSEHEVLKAFLRSQKGKTAWSKIS